MTIRGKWTIRAIFISTYDFEHRQIKCYENTDAKKRLVFLDLLLEVSGDGALISDKEVREEVDTFLSAVGVSISHMFATFMIL